VTTELEKLLRKGEPRRPWWKRFFGRWWSGPPTREVRVDRRSARDLLARVRGLLEARAGWPEILSMVNPNNNAVVAITWWNSVALTNLHHMWR
jgi:hypothetical protein